MMRAKDYPAQLSIPLSHDQHDARTPGHRLHMVQNLDATPLTIVTPASLTLLGYCKPDGASRGSVRVQQVDGFRLIGIQ